MRSARKATEQKAAPDPRQHALAALADCSTFVELWLCLAEEIPDGRGCSKAKLVAVLDLLNERLREGWRRAGGVTV